MPVAAFVYLAFATQGAAAQGAGPEVRVIPVVPVAPQAAPAGESPQTSPRAPASIIRFRCEVEPASGTCQERPAPDGDATKCDCARDFCYKDGAGTRICEKS